MTVENGCTEPEQAAATGRARRLIERHRLTFAEVAAGTAEEPRPNRAPPGESTVYGGYAAPGAVFMAPVDVTVVNVSCGQIIIQHSSGYADPRQARTREG
jgi:hypothetical protein